MLLWCWFCQCRNFSSKRLKDFLLNGIYSCQDSFVTSNNKAFLIGRFLAGKGEVKAICFCWTVSQSCSFCLDKAPVKIIGSLYFYLEEPDLDVYLLIEIHSEKWNNCACNVFIQYAGHCFPGQNFKSGLWCLTLINKCCFGKAYPWPLGRTTLEQVVERSGYICRPNASNLLADCLIMKTFLRRENHPKPS